MLKKNKMTLIITTLIMLLPIIAGFLMWNALPDKIVTHWGIDGTPDTWSNKAFAVFGIPLFIIAIHWVCVLVTAFIGWSENIQGKALRLVLWICPVISLVCMTMVYASALGLIVNVEILMPLLIGIMLIVVGNYLPKCKRNNVIGIKIPWTLKSDENWYHTHRFGSVVWVIAGFVMILMALLRMPVVAFVTIFVAIILPFVFSLVYYLKKERK